MSDDEVPYHRELDARGLNCPLPILHARRALDRMADGEVLRVVSTDPAAGRDFARFARLTGHEITGHAEPEGECVLYITRRG